MYFHKICKHLRHTRDHIKRFVIPEFSNWKNIIRIKKRNFYFFEKTKGYFTIIYSL